MKGLLFIIPLVLLGARGTAQEFSIDSLKKINAGTLTQEEKANVCWKLGCAFTRNNLDSTIKYSTLAISLGKKNSLKVPLAWGLLYKGNALGEKGNYDSCLSYERKGLNILKEISNQEFLAIGYNLIGNGFAFQRKDDSCIHYFLKSIEKGKSYGYVEGYVGLAKIYNRTRAYKLGFEYAQKALQESGSKEIESKIRAIGMIGRTYYESSKYDSAFLMTNKALDLARKHHKDIHVRNYADILASMYIERGNLTIAKPLVLEAYAMAKKTNAKEVEASCLYSLAEITLEEGNNKKAMEYGIAAYNLAKADKIFYIMRDASMTLVKISSRLGDLKAARFYQNEVNENFKADFEISNSQAIIDYQIKYETLQKEQENAILKSKQLAAEATVQRQKTIVVLVGMALIFVIVLALLAVRAYRNKKRINELLELNNSAILSTNAEIELRQTEIERQKNEIEEQKEQLSKALQEREEAQAHLVHSEKMASLGQLMSGIAHELNNPITFISAGTHALKEHFAEVKKRFYSSSNDWHASAEMDIGKSKDDEFWQEVDDLFNAVLAGADRSTNIVSSLRAFSYKSPEGLQQSDLIESIEATLTMLQSEIKNRIEVQKNYHPIPLIECNIGEISQVFMNIIANAVQAISGHGKIWIKTYVSDDKSSVVVSVKDSGHGIPENLKTRIFDPFFTTKPHGKGTGLGLSISYKIIEKHRGNINVFSKPGEGAEFVIAIPVR